MFQRIVSVDRIDDCVSIGSNLLFGIEVRIARDCPARGLINAGKVIVSMGTNAAIAPIGSSRMPGIVSIRLAQLETPCTMPETACTRHRGMSALGLHIPVVGQCLSNFPVLGAPKRITNRLVNLVCRPLSRN